MREFYDCVTCVILMDKATSNRVCCKLLSVFSCGALLWNLCVLFALRPYLPGRAEAEESNKGARSQCESYNQPVSVLALLSGLKVASQKTAFTWTFLELHLQSILYSIQGYMLAHQRQIPVLYNLGHICIVLAITPSYFGKYNVLITNRNDGQNYKKNKGIM